MVSESRMIRQHVWLLDRRHGTLVPLVSQRGTLFLVPALNELAFGVLSLSNRKHVNQSKVKLGPFGRQLESTFFQFSRPSPA